MSEKMGRPSLYGEPASAAIRIRVTPEQRQELVRVARENGTNVAGVIREAVNEFVADYRDVKVFRGPEN